MLEQIFLSAKTNDCNFLQFVSENGQTIFEHNGHVPNFFPEEHHGDYIKFQIDIETGTILNWPKITKEEILELVSDEEYEEILEKLDQ